MAAKLVRFSATKLDGLNPEQRNAKLQSFRSELETHRPSFSEFLANLPDGPAVDPIDFVLNVLDRVGADFVLAIDHNSNPSLVTMFYPVKPDNQELALRFAGDGAEILAQIVALELKTFQAGKVKLLLGADATENPVATAAGAEIIGRSKKDAWISGQLVDTMLYEWLSKTLAEINEPLGETIELETEQPREAKPIPMPITQPTTNPPEDDF